MASPWTFFARLVPLQRQNRDKTRQTDGVSPGMSEIAKSGEHPVGKNSKTSDLLGDDKSNPSDQSESCPGPHGSSEDVEGEIRETIEEESAEGVTVFRSERQGTGFSPTVAASRFNKTLESAPPKRRRRAREAKNGVVVTSISNAVVAVSDDVTGLDREIRALRGQLVTKLHLQNEQLKRMLERFERRTGGGS